MSIEEFRDKVRQGRIYLRWKSRRRRDFLAAFDASLSGNRVLADIRGFCYGSPLDTPNPIEMARLVGRREVWDHIQAVLDYDGKQIAVVVNTEREQREKESVSA